jgi:hypothetical protein
MKLKYTTGLLSILVAAGCVAVAVAQQIESPARQRTQSQSEGSSRSTSASFGNDVAQELSAPAGNSATATFYPRSYTTGVQNGLHTVWSYGGEEAGLAGEAGELVRKLEAADSDTARTEIKSKLAANLGKQFDARQKHHEQEIKALEAKVKKLKDIVSKRQESREQIIAQRVEQMLRESQGLGW